MNKLPRIKAMQPTEKQSTLKVLSHSVTKSDCLGGMGSSSNLINNYYKLSAIIFTKPITKAPSIIVPATPAIHKKIVSTNFPAQLFSIL